MLALRSIARRVLQLTAEERELAREIETLTRKLAPQLLDQPGVGTARRRTARPLLVTPRTDQLEAAFARLAGAAPIPASSGQTVRYRLDRSGDRKLNRALHMILVTRKRSHPATIAYIERRLQEGKTRREANRCLKRYLARNLYRLLEHGPPLRLDRHRSIPGACQRPCHCASTRTERGHSCPLGCWSFERAHLSRSGDTRGAGPDVDNARWLHLVQGTTLFRSSSGYHSNC